MSPGALAMDRSLASALPNYSEDYSLYSNGPRLAGLVLCVSEPQKSSVFLRNGRGITTKITNAWPGLAVWASAEESAWAAIQSDGVQALQKRLEGDVGAELKLTHAAEGR